MHALAAAYSLLSKEGWRTVSLEVLLLEELKPFLAQDGRNVELDGPEVYLDARAALALGMAVHELTTNAVKYGALSATDGRVRVAWRVEQGSDGRHLVLDWVESDGPPVVPPERRGFGMTLIERGLRQDMSAEVEITFPPDGVRATLRAPLTTELAAQVPDDAVV